VLAGLGRQQEARPLYAGVLASRRRVLGSEHPLVAQSLRDSGRLHLELGEYPAATQQLQEALDILGRLPGDHALERARTVYFMGRAHLYRDDLAAAEPLFSESLASTRRLLGHQHPLVAEIMERLGVVYRRSGRYAQAEQLLRELLDIHRTSAGEASPTYAGLLLELALLARVRGDCEAANALSQQSLSLYRQSLPQEHWELARGLSTRAYLLESWGDTTTAAQRYREALEMSQRLPNEADAYGLAVFRADLASLYVQMDQPEQAGPLLALASETLQRLSPERTWFRAHLDSVRGLHANELGDAVAAERLLLDSLQWLQDHHGPHRMYTQRALARVIAFYESNGQPDKARAYRTQVDDVACQTPMSLAGGAAPP
jgi:tetratricopeptide (TPR) repeat protein